MSVDKLKIFKKAKGADNYSKNPIIDSLIRQKLHSEMILIKDNFHQIIRRQEREEKQPKTQTPIKRKLSTNNLASINSQKIKESINYNHNYQLQVVQFVSDRQKASPFFTVDEIESNNTVRTNPHDFFNKLHSSGTLNYSNLTPSQSLEIHLKSIVPSDVWLNQLPQVDEIMKSRAQAIESKMDKSVGPFKLHYNNRPASQNLQPIKSRLSYSQKKLQSTERDDISYETSRYHKGDYKGLQSWLQRSNSTINKKYEEQMQNKGEKQMVPLLKQNLNQIYTVYLSAIKEIIRLTYIESAEKGLLLEKVLWSLIRLFQELIGEQHRLNFEEFKLFRAEMNEFKHLFEGRVDFLEKALAEEKRLVNSLIETKRHIILSYLSYKRVNEEMNVEIERLMSEIKENNSQNNYLMSNLSKVIHEFHSRDLINTKKQDQFTIYYYLNRHEQMEIVAKTPNKQLLDQYFKSSMISFNLEEIQTNQKEDEKVQQLDNHLNVYWDKKRKYLEIDQVIQKDISYEVDTKEVQVDGRGPNPYVEKTTQFPQSNQQTFQDFLKRQIEDQRENWLKKEEQYKEKTFTLKEVYTQAYQSIQALNNQNKALKQSMFQKDSQLNYLHKKLEQLDEKVILFSKKINMLDNTIQEAKVQEQVYLLQIQELKENVQQESKKYVHEKENNIILAGSIFEIKGKVVQAQELFAKLQQKIKILAPHFQKLMALADESNNQFLLKLSNLLQLHLKGYVEKDTKVFLTY